MKINPEYDTGLGTTIEMWKMLSEILAEQEEKLPLSLNDAILALADGEAQVVLKEELLAA